MTKTELEGRVMHVTGWVSIHQKLAELELSQSGEPRTVRIIRDIRDVRDISEIKGALVRVKEEVSCGQPRDGRGRAGYNSKRTYTELEVIDGPYAGQKYVSDITKGFT